MKQTLGERSLCHRIASRLENDVGTARYERYFQNCVLIGLENHRLQVAVPNSFYASWLQARFGEMLCQAARAESGDSGVEVDWNVDPSRFGSAVVEQSAVRQPVSLPQAVSSNESLPRATRARRMDSSRAGHRPHLGDRYTFENFVVGVSNRLAHDAAVRLASIGETMPFKAMFVHGECGVGKTHLLNAIAHRYTSLHLGARVRVLTAEQFTNDYITAVRSGTIEAFRASLRRLDLLCIDDLHFLGGKGATQQEFLHTFDVLDLGGSRVALASDAHPRDLGNFTERLVSRCLSGLVVRIERPDETLRREIIRNTASARGLRFDEAALEMVAMRCVGSIRDIEGAIARIEAVARLTPGAGPGVSAALIRMALGDGMDGSRPKRPMKVTMIADIVCKALAVELSEVLGPGRHKRVVLARSVITYLARQLTTHSYPEIAHALNRRNHSTVVTAFQRFKKQIEAGMLCEGDSGGSMVPASELCEKLRRLVVGSAQAQMA